ncbi:MAG: hypothetical protein ACOH2E_06485 [Candidatus Paracaedibacter sp.]
MFLNFIRYHSIILLNFGLHSFSIGSELQSVYNKYDQISQLHLEAPRNLCKIYEFHKTHILYDYKGYYANKEHSNKKISQFCFAKLCTDNPQEFDEELLLTIQYANNPTHCNRSFKIIEHPNPGHSGAEIYILHGNNMKNTRIAKIFKCRSLEELKLGFLELSNSLIALSLNPDPSNIKMTRILSAGFSFFKDSENPYIFCMLIEAASGDSIKELLHNKFIDNPDLFYEVLNDSAQYLAYFHVNSYEEFIKNKKIDAEVKMLEIKDREEFCLRRIRILLQDLGFGSREDFCINFKDALKNIKDIFGESIQTPIKNRRSHFRSSRINTKERSQMRPNSDLENKIESTNNSQTQPKRTNCHFFLGKEFLSLRSDSDATSQDSSGAFFPNLAQARNETSIPTEVINQPSFGQHLSDILCKFKKWELGLEDRVITHGDMHIGNLCYSKELQGLPLHRLTMIDFSSMKRTYGAIGDPAQDVGKFLGSIWKKVALCSAQKYGDKGSMETLYSTLYKWQDVFLSAYIEAYTHANAKLHEKSTNHSGSAVMNQEFSEPGNINKMGSFRERVYFYKLCLYAQFFDDTRMGIEAEDLLNSKQLLFYFLLHEAGLLGASNLISKDPAHSSIYISVDFSLSNMGQAGHEVIDEGVCFVLNDSCSPNGSKLRQFRLT